MTPTTGPVSIPIRTSSGRPVSAEQRRTSGSIARAVSAIRLGVIIPWERNAGGDHIGVGSVASDTVAPSSNLFKVIRE